MFFLASFVHRDMSTWREQMRAHIDWLYARAADGTVAASGPILDDVDGAAMGAMILLRADNRAAAMSILDTDPFVRHDVTQDLTLSAWNPFIGVFADQTTPPDALAEILNDARRQE